MCGIPNAKKKKINRSSISIACWVVVYSPQIIENFRRSSADGLSLAFLVIWLLGDISNVLGAVLQGVLPTMTILAMYYVIADFVLLGQRFYYRGSGLSERAAEDGRLEVPTEETALLGQEISGDADPSSPKGFVDVDVENPSARAKPAAPAPMVAPYASSVVVPGPSSTPSATLFPSAFIVSILSKVSAVILVCLAGVGGWYLSSRSSRSHQAPPSSPHVHPGLLQDSSPHLNLWGQLFGYLCAACYLGSRIPQILLNHSRKSTEGVSILFFIFCCIGNITYALSIFAYEPRCAGVESGRREGQGPGPGPGPGPAGNKCEHGDWQRAYWRYILVDASWVVGSLGALTLDSIIFVQFWMYRGRKRG